MADPVRERPKVSHQQFGNTAVSDNSLSFQGIVHGDVHLNQRPVTPPSPTAIIPFCRDLDFVERKEIIDRVHQLCANPAAQTALLGLGGVGKSQIAIEYAYRVRERSPETWVFWIHASNAARYEQSFRDIAEYLKIPGRRDPQSNVYELVSTWLRDETKGKWVVILDNLDEAGFFFNAPNANSDGQSLNRGRGIPLRSYLPYCQHGALLATTRSRDVAFQLVERRSIVVVEPMNAIDALALAEKKLGGLEKQTDIESAKALTKALEYMPLAITQATAYIAHKAPRCSIEQYLEKFKQSDRKKIGLLDYDRGQLRRDREASNSIITTWQISFNYIREARRSATDLLSLMSFCDRQGIPESLLRASTSEGSVNKSDQRSISTVDSDNQESSHEETSSDESDSDFSAAEAFEQDISTLEDYSFISTADGGIFQMHRLVQLAMRKWLQAEGEEDKWRHEFITRLSLQFPTGEYENWPRCQELLPHATSAAAQRPKTEESVAMWTDILYKVAWYFWKKGQGLEAQKMAEDATKARSKRLGRRHDDTLHAMSMVGHALMLRGQWKAAEELFVEVMETSKQKLGLDHPSTLASMANLASTYRNQGRWDKAEELFVEVMETSKQKLGLDHPSTLASMANLASTYWNQGRWDKAEELFVEVMETSKQKLGLDHPDTLTSMANLASTYRNQGRWDKAEELFVEVMETRKQKLGLDHPSTLTSMANLASTYRNQGRWDKAEELDVEVMEMSKQKLGLDHPDTLTSMANLASTYWNQGRWDKAEELFVEVMETSKQKLGLDHPDTLTSMANLAFTWHSQGRIINAIDLMDSCGAIRCKVLGSNHPHTSSSLQMSETWRAQQVMLPLSALRLFDNRYSREG